MAKLVQGVVKYAEPARRRIWNNDLEDALQELEAKHRVTPAAHLSTSLQLPQNADLQSQKKSTATEDARTLMAGENA